jgi:glycosyltransferase involved in cell wall biosynthesis
MLEPLRVLYWAVDDEDYPRNSRIRRFLEADFNANIKIVPRPTHGSRASRFLQLSREAVRLRKRQFDLIILSEFSLQYAITSWIASRRTSAFSIVDFFVGLDETETGDHGLQSTRSFRSFTLRSAEWFAVKSARMLLTDTQVRARRFEERFSREFTSLPVGAPEWLSSSPRQPKQIDLLYYGNYLPLHGVDRLVEAIDLSRDCVRRAVFVGDGPARAEAQELTRQLGLSGIIEFVDNVPMHKISQLLSQSRVSAGVFGTSVKAREVIANKVWQSLAAGVATVTRESPALDEIRNAAGGLLRTVASPEPTLIANAIRESLTDQVEGVGTGEALEDYVTSRYAEFASRLRSDLASWSHG